MNFLSLVALLFVTVSADPAGGFFQKGMHSLLGNRLYHRFNLESSIDWPKHFPVV